LSRLVRAVLDSSGSFIPFLATLIVKIGFRPVAIVFVAVASDLGVVIAERRSPRHSKDTQKTFKSSFNHYIYCILDFHMKGGFH
jgi:hypothetical protein